MYEWTHCKPSIIKHADVFRIELSFNSKCLIYSCYTENSYYIHVYMEMSFAGWYVILVCFRCITTPPPPLDAKIPLNNIGIEWTAAAVTQPVRWGSMKIYHECEGEIEKSVPRIAVWHHEACQWDGFFYLTLTRIMDSFSCSRLKKGSQKFLNKLRCDMTW